MKFLFALLALCAVIPATSAQFFCTGRRSGGTIFTDVVVRESTTCILENVVITGSIRQEGGNLVTNGFVNVSGSITAHGTGTLELLGRPTVMGVVSISAFRGSSTIGPNAKLGSVFAADTDVLIARGTMSSLSLRTTKVAKIEGARILLGGLSVEQGLGDVTLCGSTISGGVQMLESKGSLIAVTGAGCSVNSITGSIFVLKGTGDLLLQGAQVSASDVTVSEQIGHVFVRNSNLSDITIGGVQGNVTFENVVTDSDLTMSGNTGTVRMINGNVKGDMRISGNNGGVDLRSTNFNFEVVLISGNSGPVSIYQNTNLSIGVNENTGGVFFIENQGRIATINNNQNGVLIRGNTLTALTCVDNIGEITSGVPGQSTNSVSGVKSGQCANF